MTIDQRNIKLSLNDLGISPGNAQTQHFAALREIHVIEKNIIHRSKVDELPIKEKPARLAKLAPAVQTTRKAWHDLLKIQDKRNQI